MFKLLKERSKLENTRPDTIDFADMKRVIEHEVVRRTPQTAVKRNILNVSYFIVTNPKTNQYFRLDEKEKFLWDHMDGSHTIRDLALAYYNEYGAFAYDKIIELVYDLRKKTFLTAEHVDIYQELSLWAQSQQLLHQIITGLRGMLSWEYAVPHIDRFFAILYHRVFRYVFFKPLLIILGLATIAGFGAFVAESFDTRYTIISTHSVISDVVLLFVLTSIALLLHEIAHGVATKHFGRKVHKGGFLLYFLWPAFFVDTTDMWFTPKWKRIAVSLAGPATEGLIAGLVSIALFFLPNASSTAILYKFALVSYTSVFINLNPLLEWDGYFVFMDSVGIPCLRRRSIHFITQELVGKITKGEKISRTELFYSIFGGLSLVWSAVALVLGLLFWQSHIKGLLS